MQSEHCFRISGFLPVKEDRADQVHCLSSGTLGFRADGQWVPFTPSARDDEGRGLQHLSSAPTGGTGLDRTAAAITADLLRRGLVTPHEVAVERPHTFKAPSHKFAHLRGLERTAAAISADLLARGLVASAEQL